MTPDEAIQTSATPQPEFRTQAGTAIGGTSGTFQRTPLGLHPVAAAQSSGPRERLAYSIQEAADLLGVNYFSVYRLIRRGKLRVCRALRGKMLIARVELLRLLADECNRE